MLSKKASLLFELKFPELLWVRFKFIFSQNNSFSFSPYDIDNNINNINDINSLRYFLNSSWKI